MKTTKYIIVILASLAICGCAEMQKRTKLSEREEYRYQIALQAVEKVEALCKLVEKNPSQESIQNMMSQAKMLKYDYNADGMNLATIQHCDSLKTRIEECQRLALLVAEQAILASRKINVINTTDQLLETKTYYPIYIKKGEKLLYEIESSSTLTAKLYNANTEQLVKSHQNSSITDSLTIANTGVYLLEITPKGKLYASVAMGFRPIEAADMYNRPMIISEIVECKKDDLGAIGTPGITIKRCFDEPRKFTLRGQIKAAFSGNANSVVAVQIPAEATDILYSLRIATSESNRSSDGKFHDNLSRTYKRVKFLGLPLYEKSTSNGLLNTLLDDNRPIREEDAYCSMYVFRNASPAKQFQDKSKPISQLSYDVDFSTVGTQSCNGRIPTKGSKTIYLGFENERMRYTNYIWVEAEAVVPTTVYHRTKYSAN